MADVENFHCGVGQRIAQLRSAAGLRQDQIATVAQSYGLDWTRSIVANIEIGRRQLHVTEILLLPWVLSYILERPVGLAEILPEGHIRLSHLKTATAGDILRRLNEGLTPAETNPTGHDVRYLTNVGLLNNVMPSGASLEDLVPLTRSETLRKASKSLGVPTMVAAAAAHKLWGRGIAEEAEARLAQFAEPMSPRTSQARKGHVTRKLIAELRAALEGD